MLNGFTKIIATMGPATDSPKILEQLIAAGVNVFRLNFSHGETADKKKTFNMIRHTAEKMKRTIGIIADLQGPKIRIGRFEKKSVTLKRGQTFVLDSVSNMGDETRVYLPHKEVFQVVRPQTKLLLNDGQIQLKVVKATPEKITTTVLVGGVLSDHKGLNLPDVLLPIDALTTKDKADLKTALQLGVDWVCLSFVQTKKDVQTAKSLIKGKAGIIVKIEKPQALRDLPAIIEEADAVMVARGDLGVECPLQTVPTLQKRIIHEARYQGKPVIVATQMLESMIQAPVPTRAEVSDIAGAVYDGVDAVMLSAETAVGKYPVQAVTMMKNVLLETEKDEYYKKMMNITISPAEKNIASGITFSLHALVSALNNPACLASFSVSGKTTYRIARERILFPILSLSPNKETASRLALVWGTVPVVVPSKKDLLNLIPLALEKAKEEKVAKKGQEIVITAGLPFSEKGSTNVIHVAVMK